MTLQDFMNETNGKTIDVDHQFGGQCWDLCALYSCEVVGAGNQQQAPWGLPTGDGTASGVYLNFPAPLSQFYDKIANNHNDPNQVPAPGSIIVWDRSLPGSGGAGHCDICVLATPGLGTFTGFDQNWGGAYAHQVTHSWTQSPILGWLTPKSGAAVPAPVPGFPAQYHSVVSGDTISGLMETYGVGRSQLDAWNRPKYSNFDTGSDAHIEIGWVVRVG